MRRIALLTLVAFGCATVRVPVTVSEEPMDAAGTIAPPILELWLESSGEIPAKVSAAADADAREALGAALAKHEISATAAGATDAVLFVRERAVGLTEERRSEQTWAKVGIVVGIVVVVVVVVAVVLSGSKGGNKSGSKGSSSSAGKSAPAPKAATPVAVRPQANPAAPAPRPPSVGHAAPLPHPYVYHPTPVYFGFWFHFTISPQPMVLAPEYVENDSWGAPEPPVPYAPGEEPLDAPVDFPAPPPPEPIAAVALQLPPLADVVRFPIEDRGLFSGPQTAIQLDLIDRATGQLLWSKAVSAEADPLDGAAVASLVDEGFAGVPWARRR